LRYVSTGLLPSCLEIDGDIELGKARANMKLKGTRIAKRGWLYKEGHVRKTWKRRYFVLSASRLTDSIIYFSEEMEVNKKGEISLKDCIVERATNIKGRGNYSFLIHTKTREQGEAKDFLLDAEDEQECNEWIHAIQMASNAIQEEQTFVNLFIS